MIASARADVVGTDETAVNLYKTANFLGPENPPSFTEDHEKPPDYILVDKKKYQESAKHINEAQSGWISEGRVSV